MFRRAQIARADTSAYSCACACFVNLFTSKVLLLCSSCTVLQGASLLLRRSAAFWQRRARNSREVCYMYRNCGFDFRRRSKSNTRCGDVFGLVVYAFLLRVDEEILLMAQPLHAAAEGRFQFKAYIKSQVRSSCLFYCLVWNYYSL